jgi:hypothetical protein
VADANAGLEAATGGGSAGEDFIVGDCIIVGSIDVGVVIGDGLVSACEPFVIPLSVQCINILK